MSRKPGLIVKPTRVGEQPAILVCRGHWVSMKIKLDEAHALADQLVDMTEHLTKKGRS